jgi:hypothetical protein
MQKITEMGMACRTYGEARGTNGQDFTYLLRALHFCSVLIETSVANKI